MKKGWLDFEKIPQRQSLAKSQRQKDSILQRANIVRPQVDTAKKTGDHRSPLQGRLALRPKSEQQNHPTAKGNWIPKG